MYTLDIIEDQTMARVIINNKLQNIFKNTYTNKSLLTQCQLDKQVAIGIKDKLFSFSVILTNGNSTVVIDKTD